MPTVFSNCEDCVYLDYIPLEHIANTSYKKNLLIMNLLLHKGLPKEIGIKIIKMSKIYTECRACSQLLCNDHLKFNDMGSPICSNCSWFEIT